MKWDLRIDGDAIVYTAGFAADSKPGASLNHSLFNAKLIIAMLSKKFPGTRKVYLTSTNSKDNFRFQIIDNYKANRKDAKKPVYYNEIREFLIKRYGAVVCQWGEADDWLGVEPTENTIIASKDKDLLMIPGVYHYRMSSGKLLKAFDPGQLWLSECRKKLLGVGFKWFCTQMITGDKIDNILKATKGFGPVTAFELMDPEITCKGMWHTVESHWRKSGKSEQDMFINAQLLWIARRPKEMFSYNVLNEVLENDES